MDLTADATNNGRTRSRRKKDNLTDTTVKKATVRPKPYKLVDGKGLYVLVQPSGSKLWQLKYRFAGKEKKLALGAYPEVSLKIARDRRDAARQQLIEGEDPCAVRLGEKLRREAEAANTFQSVAEEYVAKREREGAAEATIVKARWFLELLKKKLAARPVGQIAPLELLAALRVVEAQGNLETANRLRSFAGRVFRYAVVTGRAASDPSRDLREALTAPTVTHRAAILEPASVGALLHKIDGYTGAAVTKYALQLLPHVFVRPGELRSAEWSEIDLERTVWIIPASKTKMRKPHTVPLSSQALAILAEAQKLSGGQQFVFPSPSSTRRGLSENTLNKALRTMGYSGREMTAHGFRSTASSLLNESGKWNPDAIERALAHGDSNAVRGAYNRGAYWNERVQMAQWWSDYLDNLKRGATVLPFHRVG